MSSERSEVNDAKEHGHEPDALWTKTVAVAGLGLLGLILLGMVVLYFGLSTFASSRTIQSSNSQWQRVRVGPGVNTNQAAQRERIEAAQEAWLSRYGWIDEEQTIAHIPIDRAMELMAAETICRNALASGSAVEDSP